MAKEETKDLREEQKEIIRSRLNTLISSRGVSQADIARATGLTDKQLSTWVNAIALPEVHNLRKIADYFGVSIDYLAGREDSPTSIKPFTTAGEVVDAIERIRSSYLANVEISHADGFEVHMDDGSIWPRYLPEHFKEGEPTDLDIMSVVIAEPSIVSYFREKQRLLALFRGEGMDEYMNNLLKMIKNKADNTPLLDAEGVHKEWMEV